MWITEVFGGTRPMAAKEPVAASSAILRFGPPLIVALTVIASLLLLLLPKATLQSLTAEGAIIENISAGLLALGVLISTLNAHRNPSRLWISGTMMLLWLFMRELDYQRMFTPRSIESTGFYFSEKIPWPMKLAAATALFPFVLAGLQLLFISIRDWRITPKSIRRAFLTAFGLVAVALICEKLLPASTQVVEEVSEVGFAAILVVIVTSNRLNGSATPEV